MVNLYIGQSFDLYTTKKPIFNILKCTALAAKTQ